MLVTTLGLLLGGAALAQDKTIVSARSTEISDNLDLRALASIFGASKNLEDFEQRINNPNEPISNLDLNEDRQVDYLRVVESVEGNTHLVVVQSVLGQDKYQDVATIEVEKDRRNQVQIQVVGNAYLYGPDYIYEPVYVQTPVIYQTFWTPGYHPYISVWYWNYYPKFYVAWNPWPIFRYRHYIGLHINHHHQYHYVNKRKCASAIALYQPIRSNYCEQAYPTRAFGYRNQNVRNRYDLDQRHGRVAVAPSRSFAYGTRNTHRYTASAAGGQGLYEPHPGTGYSPRDGGRFERVEGGRQRERAPRFEGASGERKANTRSYATPEPQNRASEPRGRGAERGRRNH